MPRRPWKQVQVNQEGSSGVGGLELVPCPLSSLRGEAQLEETGIGSPPQENGTPGWAPYSRLRVTGWSSGGDVGPGGQWCGQGEVWSEMPRA